ncbi:hypothetical protein [Archangium sp.]|uniref:hypothetical protein n=1 Tax=Archangium sp. TaxID=1872627 RepID=UPI00389AB5B3
MQLPGEPSEERGTSALGIGFRREGEGHALPHLADAADERRVVQRAPLLEKAQQILQM